jgi:hypothetical protein
MMKNSISSKGRLAIYNPYKCSLLKPHIPFLVNSSSHMIKGIKVIRLAFMKEIQCLKNFILEWNEKINGIIIDNKRICAYTGII